MRKLLKWLLFGAFIMVVGCSNGTINETAKNDSAAKETSTQGLSDTPKVNGAPASELESDDNLALEFIEVYINGSNVKQKKKFLDEKISSDVQTIFLFGAHSEREEADKFLNPKQMKKKEYELEGKKGSLILFNNDQNKELIVDINEGKIAWYYSASDNKEQFDIIRKLMSEETKSTRRTRITEGAE
ncbi:hypothetical protein [Paenibacillus sp. NEAU-GSW1]|uniref:hypothetical protein n=1 Tax=Paenibacillus sp. NEAU-GSW1 TaxID=2682486 RepID=UPI0012E2DE1B|nr:hypothetical protein [Paenibacillus sp. NEAU-GSW1]MUT67381.1 hypothetical protein [Paenibacillus sp. NEAU-GSW1]